MTEAVHTNGNGFAPPLKPDGHAVAPVTKIPGSIVKAIVKIKAAVAGVAKDGKNSHGGYAFASVDAMYAMCTHKMADAGLMIICLEEQAPEIVKVEKEGKTTQWGRFVFSFVLATEEDTWTDVGCRRSLYTPITGPQTFMAAQSYAEKTFLKSLFKIPTGDKFELDGLPQDPDQYQDAVRPKRKSSAAGKKDGTDVRHKELTEELAAISDPKKCEAFWDKNIAEIARMPRAWFDLLSEDYFFKMKEFGVEVEAGEQQ